MVRRFVIALSMVVLVFAAVLLTGCGDGSDRIVSPGQPTADQYNFLDGIDPYNLDQYGDITTDSLTSSNEAVDEEEELDIDISTGEEDEPGGNDNDWFKDLEDPDDQGHDGDR
jgi:hypothetical protein